MYVNYVWDTEARTAFYNSTQRSRYLESDGLVSLPFAGAPLYAIQFASASNYPLYATNSETIVILATEEAFHLTTSKSLEKVAGKWNKARLPAFQDPGLRLNTIPYLWQKDVDAADMERRRILDSFRVGDIEELYHGIVNLCRPARVAASFTVAEFQDRSIPRPTQTSSEVGSGTEALGASDTVFNSSNAHSRRGGKYKKQKTRHGESCADSGNDKGEL